MTTYLDLTWRYPDLLAILRDGIRCRDWTRAGVLRARLRALGMTAFELTIALGLLADAMDEREAA